MMNTTLLNTAALLDPQQSEGTTDLASLLRQLASAREILKRLASQRGVVLADDAGLGKTWVAALTALIVARNGGSVLIIVPGKTLQSKWETDIGKVLGAMPSLYAVRSPRLQYRISDGHWAVRRSSAGGIVITTHAVYADKDFPGLRPDLVIVDEAHRSKNEASNFKTRLKTRSKCCRWMLFLTATPFSIHIAELVSTLSQVSAGDAATNDITAFSRFIGEASKAATQEPLPVDAAVGLWRAAVAQLKPWVMRTTIDQLPPAQRTKIFGDRAPWDIVVSAASGEVIKALVRADRLMSLAGEATGLRGNDPRFHVGWEYLRDLVSQETGEHVSEEFNARRDSLHGNISRIGLLARRHADELRAFLEGREHEKIAAVTRAIAGRVAQGEKVVVFCHHIATAKELRDALRHEKSLQSRGQAAVLKKSVRNTWKEAWTAILTPVVEDAELHNAALAFVTEPGFHIQVRRWLMPGVDELDRAALTKALRRTRVRKVVDSNRAVPSIAEAVLDIAQREEHDGNANLPSALRRHAADTVIFPQSENIVESLALFNTPFGPDVLVATDKLSEGIDLHRYCRILVHYELDPSPVRVRQREGRVRRVASWAARVGMRVEYAYPAYPNTRDEALVRIIRERLERFDVLLGGAPVVTAEEIEMPATAHSQLLNAMRFKLAKEVHTCLNDYWMTG